MRGPITDLAMFSRPWGVDLARIAAPARLWIGTADKAVPLLAARALAQRIGGCSYEEMHGRGPPVGGRQLCARARMDRARRVRAETAVRADSMQRRPRRSRQAVAGASGRRAAPEHAEQALEPVAARGDRLHIAACSGSSKIGLAGAPALGLDLCLGLASPAATSSAAPSRSPRRARLYSAFRFPWHSKLSSPSKRSRICSRARRLLQAPLVENFPCSRHLRIGLNETFSGAGTPRVKQNRETLRDHKRLKCAVHPKRAMRSFALPHDARAILPAVRNRAHGAAAQACARSTCLSRARVATIAR